MFLLFDPGKPIFCLYQSYLTSDDRSKADPLNHTVIEALNSIKPRSENGSNLNSNLIKTSTKTLVLSLKNGHHNTIQIYIIKTHGITDVAKRCKACLARGRT